MADETPPQDASAAEQAAPEQKTQDDSGKPEMALKVYAPFKVYFEGEAYSISAVNETGPFDVLPKHHNFLCMLVPCNLTITTPQGEKVIKVSRALMHVKSDRVVVFMDV